jgi:hypothetical protein
MSEPSSRSGTPSSLISAFSSLRRPLSVADQLLDLSHLPENIDISDLPSIRLGAKRYIREDWVQKKRKRWSWVGDHGTYLVEIDENFNSKKTWWSCNLCDKVQKQCLYAAQSTNAATIHLKTEHRLSAKDNEEEPDGRKIGQRDVLKMQRDAAIGSIIPKTKYELFRALLLNWVVDQNVALAAVEHDSFRDLLTVLSREVNLFLPSTGDTVHNWLMAEFDLRKQDIKRQLRRNPISKIHLTFDMWTSDNHLALLGIVAHYLDRTTWTNQSRLIALRRIQGAHTGENQAIYLSEVVKEYEITDRLGFFTLDNADTNDTCLRTFLSSCLPDITNETITTRRIRCFGHVLNLAAKAFLFGKNADAFEVEYALNIALDRHIEERDAWRKHGPIGKLHNVVVFIRRTPQRRELFIKISNLEEADFAAFALNEDTRKLGVIQDNSTRWNSTYMMINRALIKRHEIDSFIARCDVEKEAYKRVPTEDHLSPDDWLILAETAAILKPFYTITMRLQSRAKDASHGSAWEVLPAMELLLDHLEDAKLTYQDVSVEINPTILPPPAHLTRRQRQPRQPPPSPVNDDLNDASRRHLRTAINNAWEKLDRYYASTEESPVYVASLVLQILGLLRLLSKRLGASLMSSKLGSRLTITTPRKALLLMTTTPT